MKEYIKLLRIKHYLKNGLIFSPLLFSGQLFNGSKLIICFICSLSFCITCSTIYIINDIKDIEKDKNHPKKKERPLARGTIKVKHAIFLALALFGIASLLMISCIQIFDISLYSIILLYSYIIINLLYSFGLKNIPIIDIIILSLGFVIRILFGGIVCNIKISNWLFLTVLSMSLYLVLGKRRNELKKNKDNSRKVLGLYNEEFLDKNIYIFLSTTIVFYSLWTIGNTYYIGNNLLPYSIIILIFIVLKYNLITEGDSYGDPIEVLLSDKALFLSVVFYIIFVGVVIYV